MKGNKVIQAKEAAQIAARHLADLMGAGGTQLEEVERSDDDRYWLITLSFYDKEDVGKFFRKYKTLKIDSTSGEVRSIKMRELA